LLELPPNQIRRFYRGGARIAAFRGLPRADDDAPEDWVASTTTVHGEKELGLSRLADGNRLREVIADDPARFFEPAHRERFGSEPGVLIKLLDAGERLPVHLHPGDEFAATHLSSPFGKTEAWIILEAEGDACVHVGFSSELDEGDLAELVAAGKGEALLARMNRMPVAAGDTIFVPAGVPHAIGAGILLLELQQPSDLSILLERPGMSEDEAFLGLARDVALAAVTRSVPDLDRLQLVRGASLFPPEADRFFRAELVEGGERLDPSFSVLIGYAGTGALESALSAVAVRRGSTVLVPFSEGVAEVTGTWRGVRCRPPVPRTGENDGR
jgi:mannose-6-phosphate isomerase